MKGSFLFIMNQPEFRQAVEVEVCRSEGQQCRTDSDAPSSGSTSCRQEYAVHRLYAFNSDGRQIYDSFSLPSACLCHHRSAGSCWLIFQPSSGQTIAGRASILPSGYDPTTRLPSYRSAKLE